MKLSSLLIVLGLVIYPLVPTSLFYFNCSGICFFINTSQTLSDAERAVGNAYEMILNADDAGANITGLVDQLNEAVGLLDEARRVYETNQTYAEELANQARVIADAVYEEALVLLAETRSVSSIWPVLVLLGIGFAIVFAFISLYYLWRRITEEEEEGILEMEVSTPEEGDQDGER